MSQQVLLLPHRLKLALLQPQIAPNTGNIARLCVATGTELHLIRPLGFVLNDRQIRRSAMDYWPRLKLIMHDDTDSFFHWAQPHRIWLFTSKSTQNLWQADFHDGDTLVFGNETHGISAALLDRYADRSLRIPQAGAERCLNLSTAAGIGLFEALRQVAGEITRAATSK
jgi:tRNA (cytidine/uridine-2'-O-)-methyltransferase